MRQQARRAAYAMAPGKTIQNACIGDPLRRAAVRRFLIALVNNAVDMRFKVGDIVPRCARWLGHELQNRATLANVGVGLLFLVVLAIGLATWELRQAALAAQKG